MDDRMASRLTGLTSESIIVLPLGAHEQHGPHLPFNTDTVIATAMADGLKQFAPAGADIRILPAEPVGYSLEHMHVEGTRSLTAPQALERWLGLARMIRLAGGRRLMLLNAHGGNSPILTLVATEARAELGMLCVATHWLRFGLPEGLFSPETRAFDIHAGDIETSLMLAIAPGLVTIDKARDFPSRQADFARDFTHLRAYGPHAFGWIMSDLNDEGATGNAAAATAEKGRALYAHALAGLAQLAADMAKFDLSLFAPEPTP